MPAARRVKWDDWKDKVMLMAVFEQMKMTSPDFTRLSQVMCGDYSADALKYDHHSMEDHRRRVLIGVAKPTETASGHSAKKLQLSCVIASAMPSRKK